MSQAYTLLTIISTTIWSLIIKTFIYEIAYEIRPSTQHSLTTITT